MISAKKLLLAGQGVKVGPLVPAMTSATAPSGVVSRSSYFGNPFGEAWVPFAATAPDFNSGSNQQSAQFAFARTGANGSLPHWLEYEFGQGRRPAVTGVDLASFNAGSNDAETHTFHIEGSNDRVTWQASPSFQHPKDIPNIRSYNFSSIGRFRYWRLRVTRSWADTTAIIQKLQFFEKRS